MRDTEFAYASAYMRTLENKMLEKADFEALFNAPSFEQALRVLSDKGYGNGKKGEHIDAETLLKDELIYIWNEVKSACPKDTPIHILLYQNDFHNLKTILKSVFSGVAYEPLILEPYTVPPDTIHRAITEGKIENLPDIIKIPAEEAYHILARDEDGQLAEIILDKALFAAMREEAKQSKNTFLIDWVDLNITIMNMKIALRGVNSGKNRAFLRDSMLECKRINADELADAAIQGISAVLQIFTQSSFEESANAARESFGVFEKWCDNALIKYVRPAKQKLFGFETVFAFFIGKQFELRAVRIILSGLRGGIPAIALRERLRDNYV